MQATLRRLMLLLFAALPLLASPNLGSVPMNKEGLTLDLLSVERRGSVLTVKWSVHNGGTKTSPTYSFGLKGRQTTTYAVDEENGTKYYALTDKEGNLLASSSEYLGSDTNGISDSTKAGETKRYWMKLPAPPPAVKTINVIFTDAEPFEAIAITDK